MSSKAMSELPEVKEWEQALAINVKRGPMYSAEEPVHIGRLAIATQAKRIEELEKELALWRDESLPEGGAGYWMQRAKQAESDLAAEQEKVKRLEWMLRYQLEATGDPDCDVVDAKIAYLAARYEASKEGGT